MAEKLYCADCGKILKRNGNFYCKNSYSTGEKSYFEGSLKRDVLYLMVLEKVKDYISTDVPDCKLKFSFSDIARIESEITSLKEKRLKSLNSFSMAV